jgi:hypothetical protein
MIETEHTSFESLVERLTVGEPQQYKNVTVYPLTLDKKRKTRYLSMKDALKKGVVEITEKNSEGTVSEIKVVNKGGKRVLLLDGEEIAGAKQNRIFNTTILLKKRSESIVPVSCTEMGRWNYKSETFSDAHAIATPSLRKRKSRSVSQSLRSYRRYTSDQRGVWNAIDEILQNLKVVSPTREMNEAFRQGKESSAGYLSHFKPVRKQRGMLVMIDGKIRGLEYISSPKILSKLFSKLLSSYVMETVQENKKTEKKKSVAERETATQFMAGVLKTKKGKFKSPGHGYDWRLESEQITGSALVYRNEIIHLTAFPNDDTLQNVDVHRRIIRF